MSKFEENPIGGLIRKAQDQLEKRAGTLTSNESVLQQDRFGSKVSPGRSSAQPCSGLAGWRLRAQKRW